ncbi:MAG: S4 domain-containing protein [candidate division WOR-3 bacterium]|nr:S4 domain-containing protein [candidate division WOR-3 bacterium]
MRLDLFLKKTLIIKQRSAAKELCDKGLVKINGITARPAKVVKVNDLVEIETVKGIKRYRILKIPQGNVKKSEVSEYYEDCSDTR